MNEEIYAVRVNTFSEYRKWITDIFSLQWKKASQDEIYKQFGEPKEYPFAFYTKKDDSEESWGGLILVKIYIRGTE
jgi:hypothetical protein